MPTHLFLALYEYFLQKGEDADDIIEVDSDIFKMNINLRSEAQPLPADEASEGEDE